MPKYVVKSTIHRGTGKPGAKFSDGEKPAHKVYNPGDEIELTEAEAKEMPHAVETIAAPRKEKAKE